MMDKKTIISAFGVAVAAALAFSAISYGEDDPASIQHRYMTPSMHVSTNAWLSVSGRVERTVADATDGFLRTEKDPLFTAWKKGASVAAGNSANANASLSVAIGADSQASDWATAVGYSAKAVNQLSTSIGSGAYSEGVSSVAIGSSAYASDNDSVAIGKDSFSHGVGTFNVNATTPSLFYLGDRTLQSFLDAYANPSVTNGLASKEEVAAVDNKADEAYSAAEQMVDAVNSLSGTIGSHIRDTDNPHKVTAEQINAVPSNTNYVQIGANSYATPREDGGATAIGENAKALGYRAISIGGGTTGNKAVAEKSGAIQIGNGSNTSNNTLQVYGYRLLDANGYIPKERIAQTTLMLYDEKNSLTWQMGVDPDTGNMMWYAVTNVDITGNVKSIPEDKNYVPIPIQ